MTYSSDDPSDDDNDDVGAALGGWDGKSLVDTGSDPSDGTAAFI
jgi:hypothetical protein